MANPISDAVFYECSRTVSRKYLTIVISQTARLDILQDGRRFKLIRVKTKPRTMFGIPFTVDHDQKEPFRIVER
jgi:hypothetical protein